MKQQKDNWVKILFSFAAPCKGKMALSVFCAILSVAGGFIPFWAVYEILLAFINQNVTLNGILIWCLVGAAGYLLRVACHGISTILAHISAYTSAASDVYKRQGGGFRAAFGTHDPGIDF